MRRQARWPAAAIVACVLAAPATAQGALRFELVDGTPLSFAKPYVWCGHWSSDVRVPALRIAGFSSDRKGWWFLSVVRGQIKLGRKHRFPNSFVWNRPKGAQLFVAPEPDGIEANSDLHNSSGWVRYRKIACKRGGKVVVDVNAVLANELGGERIVRVTGTLRAKVTKAPF